MCNTIEVVFVDIVAAAVLSGNRNFEGRVHPLTRANYLASPPLVVAYAFAGTVCGSPVVASLMNHMNFNSKCCCPADLYLSFVSEM